MDLTNLNKDRKRKKASVDNMVFGKVTIEDVIQFTGFEYENMVVERNGKTWSFSNEEFAFGDYSA